MNHFHSFDITRIEQTLLTCEEYFSRTTMFIVHTETFFHCKTNCFFTEYMFTGIKSIHYNFTVRTERSRYKYSIYVVVFQ